MKSFNPLVTSSVLEGADYCRYLEEGTEQNEVEILRFP